jgi:Zn-dependent protease
MNPQQIIDGLIFYFALVILLTFHEYGHAWMAWKCGDDTAKRLGRLSLNPVVHLDLWGTVIIPLAMIFLYASGSKLGQFLVGWAKPVPVDSRNLRHPQRDDIMVSMAGPAMNILLAVVLLVLAKVALLLGAQYPGATLAQMAWLSLMLCFFNLLPIPPLDGSHVLRVLTGMSYKTYYRIAQYGFIVLIVILQIPQVRHLIALASNVTFVAIASVLRLSVPDA